MKLLLFRDNDHLNYDGWYNSRCSINFEIEILNYEFIFFNCLIHAQINIFFDVKHNNISIK